MKRMLKIRVRPRRNGCGAKSASRRTARVVPIDFGESERGLNEPEQVPIIAEQSFEPLTVVEMNFDVGFGNGLFIRGEGAGLSWDKGQPMVCIDGKTWRWSAVTRSTVNFKVLLNDVRWTNGENIELFAGEKGAFTPSFE